jgi:N-acetylglucosaminyldiphosphoundecaprenol N-acetyl-beta-D-mannosaminyltransferase
VDSYGAQYVTIAVTHIRRMEAAAPATAPRSLPVVSILGMRLHAVTEQQAVAHILEQVRLRRGGWVITPNVDHLRRFTCDQEFASCFPQADLVLCDGMPLVWASKVQGTPLPQRVAGSDLIWSLSAAAAAQAMSLYFLGGLDGAAEAAARVLQAQYPGLQVAGIECPPLGFDKDEAAVEAIVNRLQNARPSIILVALGSPKQEQFIARFRQRLPEAWWIGLGASFDFVAGQVQRAPLWMRKRGLEWVYRLCQEPRRLFRRYLVDGLPFTRQLFLNALWNRLTGRAAWFNQRGSLPLPADHAGDVAAPAKQFMAACDWAICMGLIVLAHGPLLCYGTAQLWMREAYQFFPLAWLAAVVVGLIRLCGATFERPNRFLATLLFATGGGMLLTAMLFWSWSLGALSLLLNFAALAYWAGGMPLLRSLAPAVLIFLTTLPPPFHWDDRLLTALRGTAVHGSSRILDAVGVLHVVSGNLIEIPGRRLFVAEACSGINSVMSSMAFAVACAMFRRRGLMHTVLLTLLAVLFAIAGNILRISLGTALIEWWNFDLITGWKHETAGMVIFAGCACLILSADHLVKYLLGGAARLRPPAHFNWPPVTWSLKSLMGGYVAAGAAAAIVIAPHVLWVWPQAGPCNLPVAATFALPAEVAGWTQMPLPQDFNAETTGKKSQFWSFSRGTSRVIVALDYPFMAYHDLTECYQGQGWTLASRTVREDTPSSIEEVTLVRPGAGAFLLFALQDERGRWLVSSEHESFTQQLLGRLALSGRAQADPRPSYQMQVLYPQEHPLTDDEKAALEALFRDVRRALSQQLMVQLPPAR